MSEMKDTGGRARAASRRHRGFKGIARKPPENLTFKIAETKEDFQTSLRFLHDVYVASGLMQPEPSGIRLNAYHALPNTRTLLALWDSQIVGTVSIICDNPLGLPMDQIFDLSQYRDGGRKVAEISGLALENERARHGDAVIFPLLKFMYEYCTRYLGVDLLVIATHPGRARFFESLLEFEPLSGGIVENYDFVNGAPAAGMLLDLRICSQKFSEAYGGDSKSVNFFNYFTEWKFDNFQFPEHTEGSLAPAMSPDIMDSLFRETTDLFFRLSVREKQVLWSLYHSHDQYKSILPPPPSAETATEPASEIGVIAEL